MTETSTALTTMGLSPADVVENASTQAKLLMNIVEQTGCYQKIRDEKYLQVEAWETIGAFNRVHAVTREVTAIGEGESIRGYMATVELVHADGAIVGAATMPCFFTENACKGKEGDAKHKAAMSAAQTFATSKAYRMNYSYVAILAGYQPTPAEEITGSDPIGQVPSEKHWCSLHEVAFFKKGKMKGYAHKYTDDDGEEKWCNESDQTPEASPESTGEAQEPSKRESNPKGRDAKTITSWHELQMACRADFGLQPKEVKAELNISSWDELTDTPWECYLKIADVRREE